MKTIRLLLWIALTGGWSFLSWPANAAMPEPGAPPAGLGAADWSGLLAARDAHRHAVVRENDGSLHACNPGQDWQLRFDGRGFTTTPAAGGWTWGLELRGYGFPGREQTTGPRAATVSAQGNRAAYTWDGGLEEWFLNDRRGLEQGWTLPERPPAGTEADAPLRLTLAVRGGLSPRPGGEEARSLSFTDAVGATVLTYGGLKAWDADGKSLAVRFESVPEDAHAFRVVVDERGAHYPVTIDPVAQQAYLKASNTEREDRFGDSVAISGDTVVIGAPEEDSNATGINGNRADNSVRDSGAAYVFVRCGGVWRLQAYLKASNTGMEDWFGYSVAISGDTVVVGAPEEASQATGVNGSQADNNATSAGAAYIFVRSGTRWSQQAYLKASNTGAGDFFGRSVAISDDTAVIGAPGEDSNATGVNGNQADNSALASGAAYVFVRDGTSWSQQAYLKASNTDEWDWFGSSVAISGHTVVVGAPYEDSQATGVNGSQAGNSAIRAGAAYIFRRHRASPLLPPLWTQEAYLKASNTGAEDYFGRSVAISGHTVVVGAPREDSNATGVNGNQADNGATDSGAAYVFVHDGTSWIQQASLKASNTRVEDWFGSSVAISGDLVVVGTLREDSQATGVDGNQADNGARDSGAAYVFGRFSTQWSQRAYLKASNTETGDKFGGSVAISGGTVVVGAFEEDSEVTGVNGNQADNSATSAGAAYIFTGLAPPEGPRITGIQSVRNPDGSYTVTLTGTSLPLLGHTLQSSPDLSPGSWLGISTATTDADGNFTFGPLTEPASRPRYFYRVEMP